MFKVNNKDTRTTCFTPCSSVSIVNFECNYIQAQDMTIKPCHQQLFRYESPSRKKTINIFNSVKQMTSSKFQGIKDEAVTMWLHN